MVKGNSLHQCRSAGGFKRGLAKSHGVGPLELQCERASLPPTRCGARAAAGPPAARRAVPPWRALFLFIVLSSFASETMSAAAGAKKAAASYWRLAGLTYLDALNASTSALRRCVCSSPRGSAPGELRVRSRGAVPRQRLRAEAFRALRGAGCVSAGRREARTAVLVSSAVLLCARPSPSRCRVPCRLFFLAAHPAAAPGHRPPSRRSPCARSVLKEPARSEAMGKSGFRFREFGYEGGKELAPKEVASDPSMRKDAK